MIEAMDLNLLGLFAIVFMAAVAVLRPNVAFAIGQVLRHGRMPPRPSEQ